VLGLSQLGEKPVIVGGVVAGEVKKFQVSRVKCHVSGVTCHDKEDSCMKVIFVYFLRVNV
jgi:hypothetical protein